MNLSPEQLRHVWRLDQPADQDMTFMLATLQRLEQRRLRRQSLMACLGMLLLTLLLASTWPMWQSIFDEVIALINDQQVAPIAWVLLSLLVSGWLYVEHR